MPIGCVNRAVSSVWVVVARMGAWKLNPLPLLSVGAAKRDESLDPAEHAALAAVCLGIANLDEALSRE